MHIDPKDAQDWAQDLKRYDQERKEALRFDSTVIPKHISQREVKLKETQFHPILQLYSNGNKELQEKDREIQRIHNNVQKTVAKVKPYMHEYNLINLEQVEGISRPDEREKIKQNILPPNFNDYNIITNERFDESYYKNMRVVIQKKIKEKPVVNRQNRDFNIITNKYLSDHENKIVDDKIKVEEDAKELYKKTHDFNPVVGEFYDQDKEQNFQTQLKEKQINHGKDFSKRYPPSWKFRESVYLDQTKDVPEEIIMIDQINKNKKKRYELRHVIEEEYRDRNIEQQERNQQRLKHFAKYDQLIKKYDKEFDIITHQKPEIEHILRQFPPKPPQNSWDKVQYNRPDAIDQQIKFYNEGVRENVPPPELLSDQTKNRQNYPDQFNDMYRSTGLQDNKFPKLPELQQGKLNERKNDLTKSEVGQEKRRSSAALSVADSKRIKTGGFFQKQP